MDRTCRSGHVSEATSIKTIMKKEDKYDDPRDDKAAVYIHEHTSCWTVFIPNQDYCDAPYNHSRNANLGYPPCLSCYSIVASRDEKG